MSYIKQTVHKKSLLCLFCLQALLLFCAVLYYLLNRGRAFNQIYTPEDCMLSGDAVLEADFDLPGQHLTGLFLKTRHL